MSSKNRRQNARQFKRVATRRYAKSFWSLKTCVDKVSYPTREEALAAKRSMPRRALRQYQCSECNQWHLTSKRKRKERR